MMCAKIEIRGTVGARQGGQSEGTLQVLLQEVNPGRDQREESTSKDLKRYAWWGRGRKGEGAHAKKEQGQKNCRNSMAGSSMTGCLG